MGRTFDGSVPWVVGLLAGVGIALKPHFLLLPAAVEGYLAWRRRGWRARLRPEAMAIAVFVMTYAAAVAAITPNYLPLILWLGPVYAACNPVPFSSMMSEPATLVSLTAWLAFALVRPRGKHRAFCEVALIANLALLSLAFIQDKGFHYHFYPASALAMLLLGLLFIESRGQQANRPRIAGVLCGALAAVLAVQYSGELVVDSQRWKGHPERSDTPFGRMARLVEEHAKGGKIYVFSAGVLDSFPLVNYTGSGWASRHACLWFLPALCRKRR